jgi:threonine efflux protein
MSAVATLGTVALVYLPAAVIPGPNFVLIAQTAAAGSRRAAVAIASGVVAAGALLASIAVFGLGAVLAEHAWLGTALRLVCGLYLAWLGIQLWRRAAGPVAAAPSGESGAGWWVPFRRGVFSNVTNPKAAAFFGSVLTATLPPDEPATIRLAAIGVIVAWSTAWHLSVALLFSSPAVQRRYGQAKPLLNRVIGAVLVTLGLFLSIPTG